MVADNDIAVLVELVGVSGEDGVRGEGVALGEFEAESHVEVTPRFLLGRQVVAHGHAQFVDEADFLFAGGVAGGTPFHLQIVGNVELQASIHTTGSCAIYAVAKRRVGDGGYIAVGIGADVCVIESPRRCTEVGCVAEC